MSTGPVNAVFKVVSFLGVGLLMKALSGPQQKLEPQRIGELATQTAKEGNPRPIIWGRVRPISGNEMHCSAPRIQKIQVKSESGGGKGGSKKPPKQYQEHVFRTYAIRICEGPITAITRIRRNNKLVYDNRGNEWGAKNNGVFLKKAKIYLGDWDQMPDPTLESVWGVGNVPAYRGTCYLVINDEDLTDLGGAIPRYIFEAERAEGSYLTSHLYLIEMIEAIDMAGAEITSASLRTIFKSYTITPEAIDIIGAEITSVSLRTIFKSYTMNPEAIDMAGAEITSASLRTILKSYTMNPEAIDIIGAEITGASLRTLLISYTMKPEAIDMAGATITGVTLA